MNGGLVILLMFMVGGLFLMFWNKARVAGRMLCYFIRKDKSVVGKLCELKSDFVIYKERAYDIYPDFVRFTRYPSGWPPILQESVPVSLYDEEDAIPLNWINLDNRLERSMALRAALDENWMRKLVQEAAAEGGGIRINWRKILPIALIVIGIVGVIFILMTRGG